MTEFLVEVYLPRGGGDALERRAAQARVAAEELTGEGTPVTFLHSIFVPEDETCFLLYEAVSADAVHEVMHRAMLPFEHVAEALTESKGAMPYLFRDSGRVRSARRPDGAAGLARHCA